MDWESEAVLCLTMLVYSVLQHRILSYICYLLLCPARKAAKERAHWPEPKSCQELL